ncbi:MAG: 1-acyl-sn-glycerol-3-phosphate acyltransferase [Bacteroidetes bacterium]|nr:1-acyl-sn-glycerol-3-phosphate acyltransferase [Bacteroidota bacterium]
MKIQDDYADIAPYSGKQVREAVERLKQNKAFLESLGEITLQMWRFLTPVKRSQLKNELYPVMDTVNSIKDFQEKITSDFVLDPIIENSMKIFTWDGLDNLEKDGAYLYFSNHRDIVLDCALLNFTLGRQGYKYAEIAVGDNLLINQLATDLFKLNGAVTVKRSLSLRDKFHESKRLSAYFVNTITKNNRSMWVAQKSGRAKDGMDITSPSIVKMLHMSQKENGMDLKTLLAKCRIVPVAISYEFDPCDINKGRELLKKSLKGAYKKKKYEDLIQILKGLKRYKGMVHLHIGKPLGVNYSDHIEVANEIDRQIHLGYKLWTSNYIAYDILDSTGKFSDKYSKSEKKSFISRYKGLSDDLIQMVLNSYANPVRMQLGALEDRG